MSSSDGPSYHDVYVTTAKIERTRIFDLPYGYELTCNRVGGWTLWGPPNAQSWIAGEYGGLVDDADEVGEGLRVDVAGHVICDSLTVASSA